MEVVGVDIIICCSAHTLHLAVIDGIDRVYLIRAACLYLDEAYRIGLHAIMSISIRCILQLRSMSVYPCVTR